LLTSEKSKLLVRVGRKVTDPLDGEGQRDCQRSRHLLTGLSLPLGTGLFIIIRLSPSLLREEGKNSEKIFPVLWRPEKAGVFYETTILTGSYTSKKEILLEYCR
jgi:hypothetical protein